jgi:hypothetical protein
MPNSAKRTNSSVILSVILLLIAGLTTSFLLPPALASLEGKPRQAQTERARAIAARTKKHQLPKAKDSREGKRLPGKLVDQTPQKLERRAGDDEAC